MYVKSAYCHATVVHSLHVCANVSLLSVNMYNDAAGASLKRKLSTKTAWKVMVDDIIDVAEVTYL